MAYNMRLRNGPNSQVIGGADGQNRPESTQRIAPTKKISQVSYGFLLKYLLLADIVRFAVFLMIDSSLS